MNSIKQELTEIYVEVADFFKQNPELAKRRRSNNSKPKMSDSEVIAIALMQGYLRNKDLKQTFLLVKANDPFAVKYWLSYQQWIARLHALSRQIQALLASTFATKFGEEKYYIMDSKPIPVCQPIRHGRVILLREDGAYFGKSSKGWFFGFKLHLIRNIEGRIVNVVLTRGNCDDREGALYLMQMLDGGVTLADLGYRGDEFKDFILEQTGLLVITKDEVAKESKLFISQLRQRVETTFSGLWNLFIDRVAARSFRGLWDAILLKLIYFQWSLAQ